jgi:Leucine-rich repeat (LRR) protein
MQPHDDVTSCDVCSNDSALPSRNGFKCPSCFFELCALCCAHPTIHCDSWGPLYARQSKLDLDPDTRSNVGNNPIIPLGVCGSRLLAAAIPQLQLLTALDIQNNDVDDEGFGFVCSGLHSLPLLSSLRIADNLLTAHGAQLLAGLVARSTALTYLSLHKNRISAEGCTAIAQAMSTNAFIAYLNIGYNSVGFGGAQALGSMLQLNTTLSTLKCDGNGFTTDGSLHIVNALSSNSSLTALEIEDNNLDSPFFLGLAHVFSCNLNSKIKEIHCKGNSFNIQSALKVMEALASRLNQIDITEVLDDENGPKIAVFLRSASFLQDYPGNHDNLDDWNDIFEFVKTSCEQKENNRIKNLKIGSENILDCSDLKFQNDVAAVIKELTSLHPNITEFYCCRNGIVRTSCKISSSSATSHSPFSVLQSLSLLTTLDVSHNPLETKGIDQVCTFVSEISTLTKLSCLNCNISVLPTSLLQMLSRVETLDIRNNPLIFPAVDIAESGSCSILKYLSSSLILSLRDCALGFDKFKCVIGSFSMMPQLQELDFSNNELLGANAVNELAAEFKTLQNLASINVSYCGINYSNAAGKPERFIEAMGALPCLRALDMSGNNLGVAGLDALAAGVAACSSLRSLLLNNTQARVLPASLLQLLSRLDELSVQDNALVFPPAEIVSDGTCALMEYLATALELNLVGKHDFDNFDTNFGSSVSRLPSSPPREFLDSSFSRSHDSFSLSLPIGSPPPGPYCTSPLPANVILHSPSQSRSSTSIGKTIAALWGQSFSVKRSNGKVERGWRLAGNAAFDKESGEVQVPCSNGEWTKHVSISDLKFHNAVLFESFNSFCADEIQFTHLLIWISRTLTIMPQLTCISLSQNNLTIKGLDDLASALNLLTNLSSLNLSLCNINYANAAGKPERFIEAMGALPCLRILDMSGNNLGVAGLDALAAGVAACSSLRSLLLNNTQARVLPASLLQLLSRLDELSVQDNALVFPPAEIVSDGTCALMEYLATALELNLSNQNLQSSDLKWILEALPLMPQLRGLDVSQNDIDCSASDHLARVVSISSSICSLNLRKSCIKFLTMSFIDVLSRIDFLNLDDNPLVIPPLRIALLGSSAVYESFASTKMLNLSDLQLKPFDLKCIFQLLSTMPQIEDLDLSMNKFESAVTASETPATSVTCDNGHACVPHTFSRNHYCNVCRSKAQFSGMRCSTCDYDVCSKCSVSLQVKSAKKRPVPASWLVSLCSEQHFLKQLTRLNISSTGIKSSSDEEKSPLKPGSVELNVGQSGDDIDNLVNFISSLPCLRILDMSGNNLGVAGLDALAAGVAACSSLRSLLLNNTQARVLPASLLQLLSRLDELSVQDNALVFPPAEVVSDGTCALMEYLATALELNLSNQNLQSSDLKWILEALPLMPQLRGLDISKNNLRHLDLKLLASSSVSLIEKLNLSHTASDGKMNSLLKEGFFQAFSCLIDLSIAHMSVPYEGIAFLSNLTSLNMDSCNVTWPSSDVALFSEFANMQFFSSKGVKLSFSQLDSIARNLSKHQTIRQLVISDIQAQFLPASVFEILFLLLEPRHRTLYFSLTNAPSRFVFPPAAVVNRGPDVVVKFLTSLPEHEIPFRMVEKLLSDDESASDFAHAVLTSIRFAVASTGELSRGCELLWIRVVQCCCNSAISDSIIPIVDKFLEKVPNFLQALTQCTDEQGRVAMGQAGQRLRGIFHKHILFMGRFRIVKDVPEHQSSTCLVFFAQDMDCDKMLVALKFMKKADQFQREIDYRAMLSTYTGGTISSESSVVGIILHDSNWHTNGGEFVNRFKDYPYLLVMPAAERSLRDIIDKEDMVLSQNRDHIKHCCIEILKSLSRLHSERIIHGDLKPRNIVRIGDRFLVIDLDASARFDVETSGAKFSSSYAPPELVRFDLSTGRGEIIDSVPARPAHDIWSFGAILYHFLTRSTLFHEDREDHLADDQDLRHLHLWTDSFKSQKLSVIRDAVGRNLVSQLLNKDPERRPKSIDHVLQHPFFTGKQPGRMVGSKARYDVFLSYRVAADAAVAELLYKLLTEDADPDLRLNVFW